MKKAAIGLAVALLTGCVIVPMDGGYGPPSPVYDDGYGPPPLSFGAPPDVIVLPDTDDVYVVPDVGPDLFFWSGWWWRPWSGRWYRSRYYDRGWTHYSGIPSFYYDVDQGWREHYRNHNWYGHRWNYERIPNQRLQQNWEPWHESRHWERQRAWGVQGYQPRPPQQREELRHQRQEQYQREVQKHEREELQRQLREKEELNQREREQKEVLERQRREKEDLQKKQRERDELQRQQRQREELQKQQRERDELQRQLREKGELQRKQREELQDRKVEQQRKKDELKPQQQEKQELQKQQKEERQQEKGQRPEGESHHDPKGRPEESDAEFRR
jgi:hypothetical protein